MLDFWFDFISPYAYFASLAVPRLCEERGVEVRYRPVLFAALLNHWGQLGPAEIASKRAWTFRDITRYAALNRIPLQGPAYHPFNPLTALRLALPEVSGDDQLQVIQAIYAAGWGQGIDLGDPSALAETLDAAGLNGQELVARTRAPEVKAALAREVEEALALGIFGVPTFLVDGELFWGNDRLDHVALYLDGRDPLDRTKVDAILARPGAAARRPGLAQQPFKKAD